MVFNNKRCDVMHSSQSSLDNAASFYWLHYSYLRGCINTWTILAVTIASTIHIIIFYRHFLLTLLRICLPPRENLWVSTPVVCSCCTPFWYVCTVIEYLTSRSGLIENVWRSHCLNDNTGSVGLSLCIKNQDNVMICSTVQKIQL